MDALPRCFRAPQSFIHPPHEPSSYTVSRSTLEESFSLEAQQHVIIKYRRRVGPPGAHQHREKLECGSENPESLPVHMYL